MKGISLELNRMARAMASITQKWNAIHVAGTNGKGSVCTYLSALCRRSNISNGLFTSPYLVEPRDAIKINGSPISQQSYTHFRQQILEHQSRRLEQEQTRIQQATGQVQEAQDSPESPTLLTEFELGTLIAFSAFDNAAIQTGIVEVGLGGRLDSTNALHKKRVTVITKIGLDHQKLLGDTLPLIAKEKAGIMRAGVPCVVDGTNPPEVLDVFEDHARNIGAPLHFTTRQDKGDEGLLAEIYSSSTDIMPHQAQNMACAIAAFRLAFPEIPLSIADALPLLGTTAHLGRLSWLDVKDKSSEKTVKRVLVDGAHNPQSAETLAAYVDKNVRTGTGGGSVTWVVAVSQQDGKDAGGMLRTLTRPGDRVICVAFTRRPTMPWVEPVDPSALKALAQELGVTASAFPEADGIQGSLTDGMKAAIVGDNPVVLTGSLYLVGDSYRLYGETG